MVIVVTLSNWRKKLKVLLVLVFLLIGVAFAGSYLMGQAETAGTVHLDKDRGSNGSLKVDSEATQQAKEVTEPNQLSDEQDSTGETENPNNLSDTDTQVEETSWWRDLIETLSSYVNNE